MFIRPAFSVALLMEEGETERPGRKWKAEMPRDDSELSKEDLSERISKGHWHN